MSDEVDSPDADAVRLLSLSDGVFAIAITILVLSIDQPPPPMGRTAGVTPADVIQVWPEMFSYALSFLVIGNFWIDHRRIFDYVSQHTGSVTWINILFLMAIAFLPFPTSLLGDFGGWFSVVLYAASMALTGFIEYALWSHVSRGETLLVPDVDPDLVRFNRAQFLVTPVVFVISIPVAAFVAVELAFVCWSSLFFLVPGLKRYYGIDTG